MICSSCKESNCKRCVDVTRIAAGFKNEICQCRKANHNVEAHTQQIADPETGAVHAPGLVVSQEGKVTFTLLRCTKCHFRHTENEECIYL
jgi:hypothetical protein